MTQPVNFDEPLARELVKDLQDRKGARTPRRNSVPSPIITNSLSYTVRNDSGEEIPPYACMKMSGAETDPNTGRYVISVVKPDGVGGAYLFNNEYAIASGGFGQGFTDVVRASYLAGLTPTLGQYLGPNLGWELESAEIPAVMVIGDLGNNRCFGQVNKGWPVRVRIKPENDIDAGQSGLCTFHQGDPLTATAQQAQVRLDWEAGGEKVSAGKEATAEYFWQDHVWRFSSAECEDNEEPPSSIVVLSDESPAASGLTAALYFELNTSANTYEVKRNNNGSPVDVEQAQAPPP